MGLWHNYKTKNYGSIIKTDFLVKFVHMHILFIFTISREESVSEQLHPPYFFFFFKSTIYLIWYSRRIYNIIIKQTTRDLSSKLTSWWSFLYTLFADFDNFHDIMYVFHRYPHLKCTLFYKTIWFLILVFKVGLCPI